MRVRRRSGVGRRHTAVLGAIALLATLAAGTSAAAEFSVGEKRVPPAETNFAGIRQVSPVYRFEVQLNHDARLPGDLDLAIVDQTFAKLLRQHGRDPLVRPSRLTVVITTGEKIAKFGEAGQRRIFRWLEPQIRKHRDFHVSPVAIFIADHAAQDRGKLEAVLTRALALYFDPKLKDALDSVEPAPPVAAPNRH